AMMSLTDDERKVFEEILRCKEIRQDDLRRRMDFSKAKLSALVNNLEKKGMILKIRHHKTNLLRPTKEFS
ncbi:MAG: helix-turn-helix domain-containing protein, partial [Candidatus Hadarchaeales archaeon]